jgi:hypothetical protein
LTYSENKLHQHTSVREVLKGPVPFQEAVVAEIGEDRSAIQSQSKLSADQIIT